MLQKHFKFAEKKIMRLRTGACIKSIFYQWKRHLVVQHQMMRGMLQCDTVQCTMYNVQCTVYNVQCTMYSVQCTLYSVLPQHRKEGNVQKLEARKGLHLYLSDICDDSYCIGSVFDIM